MCNCGRDTCPYCKTVKEKLESEKIEFIEKLVSEHEQDWLNISELTGLPQLPTIVVNGKHLVPARDFFNQDHLIGLLTNSPKMITEYDVANFERIKTLNFTIFQAFNRLESTLRGIEEQLKKQKDEHKSTD